MTSKDPKEEKKRNIGERVHAELAFHIPKAPEANRRVHMPQWSLGEIRGNVNCDLTFNDRDALEFLDVEVVVGRGYGNGILLILFMDNKVDENGSL